MSEQTRIETPAERSLRCALDTEPDGVCTVRQRDLADVLSTLTTLRSCYDEQEQVIRRLQGPEVVRKGAGL